MNAYFFFIGLYDIVTILDVTVCKLSPVAVGQTRIETSTETLSGESRIEKL